MQRIIKASCEVNGVFGTVISSQFAAVGQRKGDSECCCSHCKRAKLKVKQNPNSVIEIVHRFFGWFLRVIAGSPRGASKVQKSNERTPKSDDC
jgi:hypothetical protein